MYEFSEFPKIGRLFRECVVTEKIDGTNAQVLISDDMSPIVINGASYPFLVGSRTRFMTPSNDNYGFAKWAYANSEDLLKLGPGRHFGEWWGNGIQRGYGQKTKIFSLFNAGRWNSENTPKCCSVVPVLYSGPFSTEKIKDILGDLETGGSKASPGFMDPEGVIVFHKHSGSLFKATIKNDDGKWSA